MFRAINRLPFPAKTPFYSYQRRSFSVQAIYSRFPASLCYYRPHQKSCLFDQTENDSRPNDPYDEGVKVAADGLVYPGVTKAVSNGAVMLPNTFTMQEYIRRYYDEFLDREEAGDIIEAPRIFTVPKGTSIPDNLILIHECLARFSLQPSHGISLKDFNLSLDEFFDKFAIKEAAEAWLDKHPYQSAIADDTDKIWMGM